MNTRTSELVDVLERLQDGNWGIREVKSGTGLKDHYVDDIAIQRFVLQKANVSVSSVELIHVNTGYVRGPGEIRWDEFFTRADVTDATGAKLTEIPPRLVDLRTSLATANVPDIEPGQHCRMPYDCEFWKRCTAGKPFDWTFYLPHLSQSRVDSLRAIGVEAISDIPTDFPLTAHQVNIKNATRTGKPWISPELPNLLSPYEPPAYYLDFEAISPPIPLYERTSPYQVIPFQWSLHVANSEGELEHQEFLADGTSDPRRQFAETLVAAIRATDLPIIVYSGYEHTRLNQLATELPEFARSLDAIMARLMDLLPVVRAAIYFPQFQFSNSLKSVAPVLSTGFSYEGLEDVADGTAASDAFLQLASRRLGPVGASRIRAALLAYCRHDTLALVEVHQALRRLARAGTE